MTVSTAKPRKKAAKKPEAKSAPEFTCEFCKKSYQRESTYLVHLCEPKRRWLDRDTKHVKLGFMVFQRFHEANYVSRKPKSFEDFIGSQFYIAFTHFGKYLLNINAVNPTGFMEFLIKSGLPIKRWESPVVYETYVRELNKKETAEAAVERNILLMQQWAQDTGEHWADFFRKVSPGQATLWIRSGRISPWVLFTASSADALLNRLSDEQLSIVQQNIDPDFWRIKLDRNKDDVEFIRQVLDEAGV